MIYLEDCKRRTDDGIGIHRLLYKDVTKEIWH